MRNACILLLSLAGLAPACAPAAAPKTVHASAATAATTGGGQLPFIEDDYARALAEARAKKRPLFIDAWAPWCHTCQSMRAYVFSDPLLVTRADDFVWLSIDTEKPESAPFLESFSVQVWPTLWVVDAKTEKPTLKWLGSATPRELAALLDDAKGAIARGDDTGGEGGAALTRGDRASAEGRREDAVREFRVALGIAPLRWPQRPRAVEALEARLFELERWDECAELAGTEVVRLPGGTSLANVALSGLDCATRAKEGSIAHSQAGAIAATVERIALDRSVPILADDRSGLFEALISYYKDSGHPTDARVLALKWAESLEAEASHAPNPAARAVFDAHRLLAYLALGDPARALPMLAQSERDFPTDYNAPARIARVYLELKRYDEALAAIDRALARGYGPRKLRLYSSKADVLRAKGDSTRLLVTLREAIAYAETLPPPDRPAKLLTELEARLADASR
jgi:thiol-disulfide isomerase/thioredoxin